MGFFVLKHWTKYLKYDNIFLISSATERGMRNIPAESLSTQIASGMLAMALRNVGGNMKLDSKKNKELIKQYPFIAGILDCGAFPADDLKIQVQKADGNLMYRQADNFGLGDHSRILQMTDDRKDQVARRSECIYAIDAENKIINLVIWPHNDEDRRHMGEVYAWSALWGTQNSTGYYSNPICEKVKNLVWLRVQDWHVDTRNYTVPEGRFGDFCKRFVEITVYTEPQQGFRKLQEEANVYENLVITSSVLTRGIISKDLDLTTINGMLYEMAYTFKDEVYFNGMQDILNTGKVRGASGQFGPVNVMVAELCGYERIQIEDSSSSISLQLQPESKNMSTLGHYGTLPQIRNLIRTVAKLWNEKPELRDQFKPDGDISVM